MMISRHGGDVYPFTPLAAVEAFWTNLTTLFTGMLLNHTSHPSNTTSLREVSGSGQRLVLYLADYINMTRGGDRYTSCRVLRAGVGGCPYMVTITPMPARELARSYIGFCTACAVLPSWGSINASLDSATQACFPLQQPGTLGAAPGGAFEELVLGSDPPVSVYEAAGVLPSPPRAVNRHLCMLHLDAVDPTRRQGRSSSPTPSSF